MSIDAGKTLEEELEQAHLLYVRGDHTQAQARLLMLEARFPGNLDVRTLLARIAADQQTAKADDDRRRSLRYTFGLNTTFRRIGWGLAGIAMGIIGLVGEGMRLPVALQRGFAAPITTQVQVGGRYNSHMVDWTRPLYYDVLYYAAFIAVGIVALAILISVSRGSAQWEEIDVPDPDYTLHGL